MPSIKDQYNEAKASYNACYNLFMNSLYEESANAWDDYKAAKEEFGSDDKETRRKLTLASALGFFKNAVKENIVDPRKAAKEAALAQLPEEEQTKIKQRSEDYKRRKEAPRGPRPTIKRRAVEDTTLSDFDMPF